MWPLGVISEKLFKMAGDDGVQEAAGSPSPDGQIPLARRSYYVDVSLTYSRHSIIHLTVRFLRSLPCAFLIVVTVVLTNLGSCSGLLVMLVGSACAAGLHLGLRPRLRAHGA